MRGTAVAISLLVFLAGVRTAGAQVCNPDPNNEVVSTNLYIPFVLFGDMGNGTWWKTSLTIFNHKKYAIPAEAFGFYSTTGQYQNMYLEFPDGLKGLKMTKPISARMIEPGEMEIVTLAGPCDERGLNELNKIYASPSLAAEVCQGNSNLQSGYIVFNYTTATWDNNTDRYYIDLKVQVLLQAFHGDGTPYSSLAYEAIPRQQTTPADNAEYIVEVVSTDKYSTGIVLTMAPGTILDAFLTLKNNKGQVLADPLKLTLESHKLEVITKTIDELFPQFQYKLPVAWLNVRFQRRDNVDNRGLVTAIRFDLANGEVRYSNLVAFPRPCDGPCRAP